MVLSRNAAFGRKMAQHIFVFFYPKDGQKCHFFSAKSFLKAKPLVYAS
jgi:hypothetical protein